MISPDELKQLANSTMDSLAYALAPFSEQRDACEVNFEALIEELHQQNAPTMPLRDFRREAVHQCRTWLRKN